MTTIAKDWRRIDIDDYEHDAHMSREELIPDLPQTTTQDITQVSQQARQALSSGQFQEALGLVLENTPYVADAQVKEAHAETVFEVLCSIKNNHSGNDFSSFIRNLSSEQQDVLIKYLYRIMATPYGAKQGGLLLSWFEKTAEIAGMGPVVRFLSDRRTV